MLEYRIAGKFGGNYIWRNGLQAAKNKYWRNLNLAIGNCAYKVTSRIAMQWQFSAGKRLLGMEKKSAACPLFLQRAGRIRCTLIGVRCFPNHACPLLRRVVIVFASRTSFLRLRGLTFDATLAFALYQGPFGLGRMTRSHVIFLGSVCSSCEKYLHVQSHSVFTRSDFTSCSFNG